MSRCSTAALKAWERNRWLTASPAQVVTWSKEIDKVLSSDKTEGVFREILEDIQEASEWYVLLCEERQNGLKEKHCLRVLSLPADKIANAYHRQRAQDFVDGMIRWRREIAALNDGRKSDEDDAY